MLDLRPAMSESAADRRGVPPNRLAWGLAGVFFALYCCVSVLRYRRMVSQGYDLGIFEEAVRAYAHGRAPIVALKGPGYNLLGDHFHPVLVLLAPFYRVFPSALTLLVAQAALMALAVVPLTRWAHEVRGPRTALLVGCLVGASWGIVKAVSDDFHEIAFAVPLLAFAATALGHRRWRAATLWSLPLLLVKEDQGLTVAAVGGYIAWQGWKAGGGRQAGRREQGGREQGARERSGLRWWGLGLAVVGLAGTAVEVLVLLPAMNPHGTFDYMNQLPGGGAGAGLGGAGGGLPHALLHLGWPPVKWLLLFLLAAPTGFLCLRTPLALLCLPTLAWRLLSDNPHYWGVSYHYSAVLMPLVFAAMIDALDRLPARSGKRGLAVGALVTAVTIPLYPLHEVVMPSAWSVSPRVAEARRLLARIPDGATVAASNHLSAQLTHRDTVSLVCQPQGPTQTRPQWVVADLTDPSVKVPCAVADTDRLLAEYRADGYRPVVDQDGFVLLRRP
ncbi:DUF2079 domain-containing protein [Streptacidiphilus cavernicola]|uniref:DUF2079 domain-containing protein n=1 Tax=Streptacidiphilus cavernicola TaxID=3342716 RepID=A0ABV6W671_9ACTN